MNLRLYFPAKPYIVTQGWGISNPSYIQFGFSKHNGQDFLIGSDRLVHSPIPSDIVETGFNSGAGNFVRLISKDKYLVGGIECYVGIVFMHGEKILVKEGDVTDYGTPLMIPDNTGFSTGPHTHGSYYRLADDKFTRLDTDKETNYTFNPQPYWTGYYAQDYYTFIGYLQSLISILRAIVVAQSAKK